MSNNQSRWYFTKESLINTPSRKCGIDYDKELSYRQQAANLIQDMGRLLNVNQLCINTAIVYMHRFYIFHSFQRFHRNAIAACALFLAAKVEEQPRKLEYVIKVAHKCLNNNQPPLDPKSEAYQEQAQELVVNENIMLQTLGFDIAIEHPHTFVVKCCQLVRASKDLAQTSYFMATNSLHLTTMCLQYRPTVVACVCIHLACKWSNWEIPKSSEGKDWFYYVDKTVTAERLEELTSEFLVIWDKCPSRLRKRVFSGEVSQGNLSKEAIAHFTSKLQDDKKVSPVKNDKSKQTSSSSGYNQPSTSKAGEPSTSSSTSSIPVPSSMTKRQSSPPPPTKKLKEEPTRTHSMSHPSQTSGQSSNVHNSLSLNAHNVAPDRQRSQSIKDDKKLSLLKNESKSKPPPPSSSSHSGQLSTSRQSSEISAIPPTEFDKRSPSPAARKSKKEIPPFLNKPQSNSHGSSGQNVAHNSMSYNAHSQGNSSFTNESRPRPTFKEDKISPSINEVRPKPGTSVANNHSSQAKFSGDASLGLDSNPSNAIVKKEKRSPSPADIKKRMDNQTNLQKNVTVGYSSQQPGHPMSFSAYKEKRDKEKIQVHSQSEAINNKSKERSSLDRIIKSEKIERPDRLEKFDRPERTERERTSHHDRTEHHERRERRERLDHHENRHDRERTDKMMIKQERNDNFERIYAQLPPLQHLVPPPQLVNNPPQPESLKDFPTNSNEVPRMPRLIPQASQERFDRLMKLERSQELQPQSTQQQQHQQLQQQLQQQQQHQQQLDIHQQQFSLQQQQQQQQQQLQLQQQHHLNQQQQHLQQHHQPQQQQSHHHHHHHHQQQQSLPQQQLPQLHSQLSQVHGFDHQPEPVSSEVIKEGVIKGELQASSDKPVDSMSESVNDEVEENDDDLDDKSKSNDKRHHHHHHHHHHQSGSSRHHGHHKKHKSKHKRKDKDKGKDRSRDRHRSDHDDVNNRDKDFKLTFSVPKEEKSEEEIERPSPIKLKISKKQINYSGSESDINNETTPSSLRIVIPKERLGSTSGGNSGANSTITNNTMTRSDNVNPPSTSSSRKRKNSPKDDSSLFQERDSKIKKEKIAD